VDDQIDQALCLTLVTNAAVLRTTIYVGDALDALRTEGLDVSDAAAAPSHQRSTITSTSAAPTRSTSTPNSGAKDAGRYMSPPDHAASSQKNNQIRSVAKPTLTRADSGPAAPRYVCGDRSHVPMPRVGRQC
jgi:hypothetical protein